MVDSLGVLVFTSGELDIGESVGQLLVAVKVVWVKTFFPPVDVDLGIFTRLDKFERVRLSYQHITFMI